jgi:hypothetical protein
MDQAGKIGHEPSNEAADVRKLDNGIAREVRILCEHGVEAAPLIEAAHDASHPDPLVRFAGGQSEGFRALEIALQNGLKATELRQVWIVKDGEPVGPQWEMIFHHPDVAAIKVDRKQSECIAGTFWVKQYAADQRMAWDAFVKGSKNGTFLFYRDYMDYHRERFTDHSLMIFDGNELVGLVPANLDADGHLASHDGLTYGGLVVSHTARLKDVLGCFHAVLQYLGERQISRWMFKSIPDIYNALPNDETAYALHLLEARLCRRDCAMAVSVKDRVPFSRGIRALIKKATGLQIRITGETSFQPFWEKVLVPQLTARHAAKPVHNLQEITLLAARFPEHIRQFSAYCGEQIIAGVTIYETPAVARAQYAAVTEMGRHAGALAHLFGWLIEHYRDKNYFDLGTSHENAGRILNHGLLRWKEGLGGRCYVQDYYEISTANYPKLEPLLQGRAEIFSSGRDLPPPATPASDGTGDNPGE